MTGMIFDIQRGCLYDGPGMRTTVFFKGCTLRCSWCHNPESFQMRPQLSFSASVCTGCGACASACPNMVHSLSEKGHEVRFDCCAACGKCVAACPINALRIIGRSVTEEEVLEEILKDRIYYSSSGGGVTFSGGEPTFQPTFLAGLLEKCKSAGLHTALETNGLWNKSVLLPMLDTIDLFLFDYKLSDPLLHLQCTGMENSAVEKNLRFLEMHGKQVILRCPILPGLNDMRSHFQAIAHLCGAYSCVQSCDLMPYHHIGAGKWKELGLAYSFEALSSASPQQKMEWEHILAEELAQISAFTSFSYSSWIAHKN